MTVDRSRAHTGVGVPRSGDHGHHPGRQRCRLTRRWPTSATRSTWGGGSVLATAAPACIAFSATVAMLVSHPPTPTPDGARGTAVLRRPAVLGTVVGDPGRPQPARRNRPSRRRHSITTARTAWTRALAQARRGARRGRGAQLQGNRRTRRAKTGRAEQNLAGRSVRHVPQATRQRHRRRSALRRQGTRRRDPSRQSGLRPSIRTRGGCRPAPSSLGPVRSASTAVGPAQIADAPQRRRVGHGPHGRYRPPTGLQRRSPPDSDRQLCRPGAPPAAVSQGVNRVAGLGGDDDDVNGGMDRTAAGEWAEISSSRQAGEIRPRHVGTTVPAHRAERRPSSPTEELPRSCRGTYRRPEDGFNDRPRLPSTVRLPGGVVSGDRSPVRAPRSPPHPAF